MTPGPGTRPAWGLPERVPLLPLNDGPHLSYAIQWFIFATIGVAGYPLLMAGRSSAEAGSIRGLRAEAAVRGRAAMVTGCTTERDIGCGHPGRAWTLFRVRLVYLGGLHLAVAVAAVVRG
jgi:hypothetical protein